jgi:hypothetical protein
VGCVDSGLMRNGRSFGRNFSHIRSILYSLCLMNNFAL